MLLQVMGLLSHITHIAFGTSVCSPGQDSSKTLEQKKLPPEEAAKLKVQAQGFEDTLKSTPEDQASLEGAGVIYAELGEYDKAVTYLTKLVQKVPNDVEAQRLLGEVQYEAGNYEASATAYRSSIRASPKESLQLQQGLISALLADKKPSEVFPHGHSCSQIYVLTIYPRLLKFAVQKVLKIPATIFA
jgi:tetratricopeptide (TPR) repeat protein